MPQPARIAIDLGAESCRVSMLRWHQNVARQAEIPRIKIVHRIPNGPVHRGKAMHWPLDAIQAGIETGLRKAAALAPEGIASIAVDSWSVDYVRIAPDGQPHEQPHCYRDERTEKVKKATDNIISPQELYARTGVLPHRITTIYQLLADPASGINGNIPWAMLPEYVLHWLGGRRVAEHTNASHTGLVNLKTGDWDEGLFDLLGLNLDAAPPIVQAGTLLGKLKGPLAALDAFRNTQLIAPACHDTASAISGIPSSLDSTLYICSGTWSLVGAVVSQPMTSVAAFDARYTNLGAAGGGYCFHSLVNGMWLLKQCMEAWAAEGRAWEIDELIAQAAQAGFPGVIDVDAEPLLLDSDMPERINHQLWRRRWATIPDVAGNEPVFARVIFESLADRYALALKNLENLQGRRLDRIHILGGASRNKLLTELTESRTRRPVEIGHPESSTIGNFAIQLAATETGQAPITAESIRKWSALLASSEQPSSN
jgi:rhamnulokinase